MFDLFITRQHSSKLLDLVSFYNIFIFYVFSAYFGWLLGFLLRHWIWQCPLSLRMTLKDPIICKKWEVKIAHMMHLPLQLDWMILFDLRWILSVYPNSLYLHQTKYPRRTTIFDDKIVKILNRKEWRLIRGKMALGLAQTQLLSHPTKRRKEDLQQLDLAPTRKMNMATFGKNNISVFTLNVEHSP